MQEPTITGLRSASESARRCYVDTVPGAPENLKDVLIRDWQDKTPDEAHTTLARSDVEVTNKADKERLLPRLKQIDVEVSKALTGDVAQMLAVHHKQASDEHRKGGRPPLRSEQQMDHSGDLQLLKLRDAVHHIKWSGRAPSRRAPSRNADDGAGPSHWC